LGRKSRAFVLTGPGREKKQQYCQERHAKQNKHVAKFGVSGSSR